MGMSPRLLRPRASGRFDPRTIANLAAWYDFSDSSTLTLDTGITSVSDKSGNGLTATESTGANQPLLVASARNGLSAADFDGSNDKLTTASIADNLTQFTGFVVCRPDSSGGAGLGRIWTRNDVARSMGINSVNAFRTWVGASVTVDTANSSFPNGSWAYVRGRWNGDANTNGISSAVNGVTTTGANSVVGAAASVANTALCLGNRSSDGARGFDGLVGEILLYSRALTTDEISLVETALKTKWGFA